MAKAGYDTSEKGTLQFLTGIGIVTGLDITKIDGLKNIDTIFEQVGDVFIIRDYTDSCVEELAVRADDCHFAKVALEGLQEVNKHTSHLEAQYAKTIAEKRSLVAGNANVFLLRKDPSLDALPKRDPNEAIRPLSQVFGHPETTQDDVKEFLTGLGIRSDEELYFNGYSLRDAMRNVVSTMASVKVACQKTLDRLNALCPIFGESKVSRAVSYLKCQIDAIDLREKDYLQRIEQQRMYATGKVVPFMRRT
jgi:hypothetical protein